MIADGHSLAYSIEGLYDLFDSKMDNSVSEAVFLKTELVQFRLFMNNLIQFTTG